MLVSVTKLDIINSMKIKCLWSCVLVLSLILLHSSVGIAAEGNNQTTQKPTDSPNNQDTMDTKSKLTPKGDQADETESKLDNIEFDIFKLLLSNTDVEKTVNIKAIQQVLDRFSNGLSASTELPQEEAATATIQTTTTTTTNTVSTTTPANTTVATNATTEPTVSNTEGIESETQPTKSIAATKEETPIEHLTLKSPNKIIASQKHFYKSPFFFFLLFCSFMTIFSLYFLYVSRRKVSNQLALLRGLRNQG